MIACWCLGYPRLSYGGQWLIIGIPDWTTRPKFASPEIIRDSTFTLAGCKPSRRIGNSETSKCDNKQFEPTYDRQDWR